MLRDDMEKGEVGRGKRKRFKKEGIHTHTHTHTHTADSLCCTAKTYTIL